MTYAQDRENGIPKLPAFILGAPTDADKPRPRKSFPPVCLPGPYFEADAIWKVRSEAFSATKGFFGRQ